MSRIAYLQDELGSANSSAKSPQGSTDGGKIGSAAAGKSRRSRDAEQALRESEERLRAVLHAATDAIISIDQRGSITAINPATERMFGYTQEELIGQNISMLMPSPYRDEHDDYVARYLRTREARVIGIGREVAGRRKDGTIFPVDLAVSEVDHLGFFTGIVRDISFRRELQKEVLEAAIEEQRRIGQELHDVTGQELTALTLFASTLVDLLNEVPRKASRGKNWLLGEDDLLRFRQTASRLSQGLVEANRHVQQLSHGIMPVQIEAEGLKSALQQLAATTNEQQNITCQFDCPVPVAVADNTAATHLYRIAQEAVNNAVRHSQGDEICISLRRQDGQIVLEVTDNGVGIDEADSPVAVSRNAQGMGLRTMKYRCGLIGGMFQIERRESAGTSVRCVLLGEQ
jgi:PAS domain S-box-containing protein